MTGYCDERSTSAEVAERAPRFAVLTVGAHEQHGAHLPLAADSIAARAVGEHLASELGGLLLPTIPYGTSYEHVGFPGTVTLRWRTLAAVVTDVVDGCWQQGIPLVFVVSGHGGNFVLNPCLRDLNAMPGRPPGCQVVLVPEAVLSGGSSAPGTDELHAGRVETSLLLHLAPETVNLARAVDHVPTVARAELTNRPLREISPTGVWGRPTQATATEGRQLVAGRAERVCAYARSWLDEEEGRDDRRTRREGARR